MKNQNRSAGKDGSSIWYSTMETVAARWAGAPEVGDASWVLKGAEALVSKTGEAGVQAESAARAEGWPPEVYSESTSLPRPAGGLEEGGYGGN